MAYDFAGKEFEGVLAHGFLIAPFCLSDRRLIQKLADVVAEGCHGIHSAADVKGAEA